MTVRRYGSVVGFVEQNVSERRPKPTDVKPDARDWLSDIAHIGAFNLVDKFKKFIFQEDSLEISREEMKKISIFASYVFHAVNKKAQLSSIQKELVATTMYKTVAGEKKMTMSDVISLATYINTCES